MWCAAEIASAWAANTNIASRSRKCVQANMCMLPVSCSCMQEVLVSCDGNGLSDELIQSLPSLWTEEQQAGGFQGGSRLRSLPLKHFNGLCLIQLVSVSSTCDTESAINQRLREFCELLLLSACILRGIQNAVARRLVSSAGIWLKSVALGKSRGMCCLCQATLANAGVTMKMIESCLLCSQLFKCRGR